MYRNIMDGDGGDYYDRLMMLECGIWLLKGGDAKGALRRFRQLRTLMREHPEAKSERFLKEPLEVFIKRARQAIRAQRLKTAAAKRRKRVFGNFDEWALKAGLSLAHLISVLLFLWAIIVDALTKVRWPR
jgi:hypothetical protein